MAQIKIYGVREKLAPLRERLSQTIHQCVMEALQFPADKRAHRYFLMDQADLLRPAGRTDAYTIIEIMLIEGRSVEAKKKLIRLLFDRIRDDIQIAHRDIEVCIQESPAHNWGFRGMHGDEIQLDYKIDV